MKASFLRMKYALGIVNSKSSKSNAFISEPVFNEDKTVVITCDASIYNSHELRQNLIKKGCRLESDADSEIILQLYEESGINCLELSQGRFRLRSMGRKEKYFVLGPR